MNLKIGHTKSKFNATSAQERVYHKRIWFIIYSDSVMHNLLDRCILYMYIYIVQWIHNYIFHSWSDVKKKSLGSTEPIEERKAKEILAFFKYLNFIVYCWNIYNKIFETELLFVDLKQKKNQLKSDQNCLLNNQLSSNRYVLNVSFFWTWEHIFLASKGFGMS